MNYELAKKLKNVGFPKIRLCERTDEHEIIKCGECDSEHYPTLSELVEACGDNLRCIERLSNGTWQCGKYHGCYDGNVDVEVESEGSTAEESVAKLWLELNKTK